MTIRVKSFSPAGLLNELGGFATLRLRLEVAGGAFQVASWWDYGYQTTAMANRTVIVDNNTWNNTHIATVGRAMASPEHQAWQIYRDLDVKYVLVVFGGFVGYADCANACYQSVMTKPN